MILLSLLALCAIAVGLFALNFWRYKDLMKLPGPSYFFIFSTTINRNLTPEGIFKNLMNLNKRYGPVVKIWMNPLKPMLIVTDLEYVKHLLSSNVHLDKSDFYDFFHSIIGNGIVTAKAFEWKTQRKLVNPGFHVKTIENYVSTMEKFGNKLITTLAKSMTETSVDMFPILTMHALEVICATILNLEKSFDVETRLEYLKAREEFFGLLQYRMMSLLKKNDFLFRFTRSYKIHQRSAKVFKNFTEKIITAYFNQSNCERRSEHCIDYLLGVKNLNDPKVAYNISTFVVAGHDTIATILSFTLYELAKYKDIQEKIVEESYSVLGGDANTEFSFTQLQQMKYLECVLKESMRKYTPLPFYDRKTAEDMVIDGFRIPKGIDISICVEDIHHNGEYYPDPDNFLPDRFMSENEGNIRPYTYIPFSLGPRGCIGKQFGMIGMKLTLAKILRHYEIHVADTAHKMELKNEFALKSTIGMPIKLTLRK